MTRLLYDLPFRYLHPVIADDPILHYDYEAEPWDNEGEEAKGAGGGEVAEPGLTELTELRAQLETLRQQMGEMILQQPGKYVVR